LQAGGDVVVNAVGALGRQALPDAEDLGEGVVQPQPRRRAAEKAEVLGEEGQILRGSVSTGPPSMCGTPTSSGRTP